jgi:hypothetical protein
MTSAAAAIQQEMTSAAASAMPDLTGITVDRVERIQQPPGNGNGNGGQAFLPAFRELLSRIEPWRGYMVAFTTMQASIAGALLQSPSGGYWPDSQAGHQAGEPIMKNLHTSSYAYFRVLSAMSFNSSILILLLLCHEGFCRVPQHKLAMQISSFCGAGCLLGALIINTCPGSPDVAGIYLLIAIGAMACIFLASYLPKYGIYTTHAPLRRLDLRSHYFVFY